MLDLNRGVITRFSPDGVQVSMYLDAPGEYMDENGDPVAGKLAEQAGFNLLAEKRRADKLRKLHSKTAQIEAEYNDNSDELSVAQAIEQDRPVKIRRLGAPGGNLYAVYTDDAAADRLTVQSYTKAAAEAIIATAKELVHGKDSGSPAA